MDSMWIVLALFLPLFVSAAPAPGCSTYGDVINQMWTCASTHLHNLERVATGGSTELLVSVTDNCVNANDFIQCIDAATSGCELEIRIFVGEEVRRSMNYCNGSDAAEWVKGIAPVFDMVSQQCVMGPNTFSECSSEMNTLLQLMPPSELEISIEQGVDVFKTLKSDFILCVLESARASHVADGQCEGATWQEKYVAVVTLLWGLSAHRPLGVYLTNDEIAVLQLVMEMA